MYFNGDILFGTSVIETSEANDYHLSLLIL